MGMSMSTGMVTARRETRAMLDDFFLRALAAGIGVALVAGPLGCFIVWRRLAYFGDTLSHAALLGVALALLFEVNVTLAVFAVSACISMALLFLHGAVLGFGAGLLHLAIFGV